MAGSAKRDTRSADTHERQRQALELRKSGATYGQIARQLNFADPSNVRRAIMSALKEIIREPAEDVYTLELERLDAMLLGVWVKAKRGDLAAIDRVLRIMERRSNFIGLDAPKKQQLNAEVDLTMSKIADAAQVVREKLSKLGQDPAIRKP